MDRGWDWYINTGFGNHSGVWIQLVREGSTVKTYVSFIVVRGRANVLSKLSMYESFIMSGGDFGEL